ncbi:MAG: hypothetical protein ACJAXT_001527, partial [Paracoccaceae bacterium]
LFSNRELRSHVFPKIEEDVAEGNLGRNYSHTSDQNTKIIANQRLRAKLGGCDALKLEIRHLNLAYSS